MLWRTQEPLAFPWRSFQCASGYNVNIPKDLCSQWKNSQKAEPSSSHTDGVECTSQGLKGEREARVVLVPGRLAGCGIVGALNRKGRFEQAERMKAHSGAKCQAKTSERLCISSSRIILLSEELRGQTHSFSRLKAREKDRQSRLWEA